MADHLFLPYLAHGHVNPMLPIAAELVRRGETVRVAVSREFAGKAVAAGAWVLPVPGHEVRVPAALGPMGLGERLGVLTARWPAWLRAIRVVQRYLAAHQPDVVLADARLPWAGPVVRRAGVPLVWFYTTHTVARHGKSPALINSPGEWQPAARLPRRAWSVAPLVRPDEGETVLAPLLEWIGDRPLLLVAPGTVFARGAAFYRRVAGQFAGSAWAVLMATGPTPVHQLGWLPPNVLARTWLPQRGLLRRAAVFLGHGGMNSVQEALLAGVPMMLAPRSREQARTASRLVALGMARYAEGALRQSADEIVGDERMRAACLAMRARLLAAPGAVLAADVLAGIATGSAEPVTTRHHEPIWSRQRRQVGGTDGERHAGPASAAELCGPGRDLGAAGAESDFR